jgi:catalase
MSAEERARLVEGLVGAMTGVPREIQVRQVGHGYKADPECGVAAAEGLGLDIRQIAA